MQPPLMTVPRLLQSAVAEAAGGATWAYVAGMSSANQARWVGSGGDPTAPADVTTNNLNFTVKAVAVNIGNTASTNQAILETLAFSPTRGWQLGQFSSNQSAGFLLLTPTSTVGVQTAANGFVPGFLEASIFHAVYSSNKAMLYVNGNLLNTFFATSFLGNYLRGGNLSVSSAFFPFRNGFAAASLRVGVALTQAQVVDDVVGTTPGTPHLSSATHAYSAASLASATDDLPDTAGTYNLAYTDNGSSAGLALGSAFAGDQTRLLLRGFSKPASTQLDHTAVATFDCDYYWVLTDTEGAPDATQIKAGLDSQGASASGSGSQALANAVSSSIQSATGLLPSQQYWLWGYAENAQGRTAGPKFLGTATTGAGALGAFDNGFADAYRKG